MTNCQDVASELHEYLDRELSPEEAERLERHLELCPTCYQLVMFESGVIKLIKRDCGAETAPQSLKNRIRSLLRS